MCRWALLGILGSGGSSIWCLRSAASEFLLHLEIRKVHVGGPRGCEGPASGPVLLSKSSRRTVRMGPVRTSSAFGPAHQIQRYLVVHQVGVAYLD